MTDYTWTRHPDAAAAVDGLIEGAKAANVHIAGLDETLRTHTSTELVNWLDHIVAPISPAELDGLGFVDGYRTATGVWRHPGAQLPAIVPAESYAVALRVDDVITFRQSWFPDAVVDGSLLGGLRKAVMHFDDSTAIIAVERRSWACGVYAEVDESQVLTRTQAWRMWNERPRRNLFGDDAVADIDDAVHTAQNMVALVGADLAASYVLEIERRYWQRRNTAGVLQHSRQDRFGLGWGNNDHHTFRSSRSVFRSLVRLFNALGFESRERFYAGEQAGWGAQVFEHPGCGGVLFTDVDLGPDEVGMDFASMTLEPAPTFGTIGMWCALHGESILGAGMHHLEGQFDFESLREDLATLGVGHMKPFSDFAHLRQAFTTAERWPVPPERLAWLVAGGHVTAEKAAEFAEVGAAGSHLENLQRRDGFKGFNQHSVSETMRVTDPRSL